MRGRVCRVDSYHLFTTQIAGALLLWLECLPEPLIPQQLYDPLLRAVAESNVDARRSKLQLLLRQVCASRCSTPPL